MFDLVSTAELTASSAIVVFFLSSMLSSTVRQRVLVAAALALWFSLIVAAGATGALAHPIGPGIPGVGLGVLVPTLLSLLLLATSRARNLVGRVPIAALVAVHSVRILGITFVLLYSANRLPAPFAPVAGWGDVAVGLLAIPLALSLARSANSIPKGMILLWNMLGVADLVTAVVLGATSAPGPIRLFHGEPSSAIMANLPWILIPCFLVPSLFFVHLCIFYRLRTVAAAAPGEEKLRSVRVAAPGF
jgi:hypothetical protein